MQKSLTTKKKELVKLSKALNKAHAKSDALWKQYSILQEEILNQEIQSIVDTKGLTPASILELDHSNMPIEWYRKIDRWFWDNYATKGVGKGGYWTESGTSPLGQLALQLKLDQNLPLERQKGILDFLPYIKPFARGAKVINIFEHTCSEFSSWSLEIYDDKIALFRNRTSDKEFKNLNEALIYVYQYLPYELKKRDDD